MVGAVAIRVFPRASYQLISLPCSCLPIRPTIRPNGSLYSAHTVNRQLPLWVDNFLPLTIIKNLTLSKRFVPELTVQ